jgi:GDPmannose 4,6-dehydratase
MKTAFITGVTGQDGSYLSEHLLLMGYRVVGLQRRTAHFATQNIEHLYTNANFETRYGDLTDATALYRLLDEIKPDEIYNLGAMSHVRISFDIPEYTLQTNTIGVLNLLEYIRKNPHIRFYQASSSEMYGVPGVKPPFNEDTPMRPQSPYGVSKLAAYHLVRQYRDGYGLFATTGILFNHESPRRGENFVTRKVVQAVARIKNGLQKELVLGNLDAKRDWGWSPEFILAIYLIMQYKDPGVFVVATEEMHSVKEFVEKAFEYVGLDWSKYVKIDKRYKRPNEVPILLGDASKIKKKLGWDQRISFDGIVKRMVQHELDAYEIK